MLHCFKWYNLYWIKMSKYNSPTCHGHQHLQRRQVRSVLDLNWQNMGQDSITCYTLQYRYQHRKTTSMTSEVED